MLLAQRVTRERERRGWNKADLARRAGVDPSYVTRIELAQLDNPSIGKVRAISEALGLDLTSLTDPPPLENPDDDALLRKLLERKAGNKPNAEMIADIIDQTAGRAPVDPDTARTILDVFGTLTRSLPKHYES